MSRPRVVIAGLGDSGLLTAIHLSGHADIVGITSKPELVSGQELGLRLTRPERWARDYRTSFSRFRRLDGARVVHGSLVGLDRAGRSVSVRLADGSSATEPYDALVISTGVANGFWRRPDLQTSADVDADLGSAHARLATAGSVAVVGGGAAAVSSALNIATTWPATQVDLYFPGDRALPSHHPRVWSHVGRRLEAAGVGLHAGHRAFVPEGFACDALTSEPVAFSTGQSPAVADAVLWAIGRVSPNTWWLPGELLDERGFVATRPTLQTTLDDHVFAIGDVAATDPLRSSARNRADGMLAHNIRAVLAGKGDLKTFKAPRSRWGSVLGPEADGLRVFAPNGRPFRFPHWSVERVLQPWIVERGIYKGRRRA